MEHVEIVEDYLSRGDLKLAVHRLSGFKAKESLCDFVADAVKMASGYNEKYRIKTGILLAGLFKQNVLCFKDFYDGFTEIHECSKEMVSFDKEFYTHAGQLLAYLFMKIPRENRKVFLVRMVLRKLVGSREAFDLTITILTTASKLPGYTVSITFVCLNLIC